MTTLSRLQLCGIRSYGPLDNDTQDIKFSSPVTLILGENGSGKTTIIEALKYACTGDYPEGSERGIRFIQEPKLNSSSTTKAFVKLKMSDLKENVIIINRCAKVERINAGKLKLSKLDSSINVVKPDGTNAPLSGRCADIAEQVNLIMGVPKPILSNVIFCHQEHSLWPLDEDSQVKKKFDEIFDATKYNKCISEFRKFIKKEKNDLNVIRGQLELKEHKKESVEKKRACLQKSEQTLSELVLDTSKKENEMKPISDKLQTICELENTLSTIKGDLAAKETEKKAIMNNRQSILNRITEFQGSDNELMEAIKNFEKNQSDNVIEIKQLKLESKEVEEKLSKISNEIQKLQVRVGQLETEKKQEREKIEDRNKDINNLIGELKLTAKIESEESVKSVIKDITQAIENLQLNLSCQRAENQLAETKRQEQIDTYRENIAKLEQEEASKTAQKSETENKQRTLNSQLKELDASDESLRNMNNKIEGINRRLDFLIKNNKPKQLEEKIKNAKDEIGNLEKELQDLERDNSILQKNYVTEENINTRTSDMIKREGKVLGLKNSHYQDFKLLFNKVPESDFKNTVVLTIKQNTNEIDNFNKKIEVEQQKITSNETAIRINEEKLELYEKKVSNINQKINEIAHTNSFEDTALEFEKRVETLQKERGQYRSAKVIYEKFVKDFQSEKPCCPVCETDFNDKRSLAKQIVVKLKGKIEGIPQALEQIESELKKKQELFNQTQQLKPLYEEAGNLEKNTIPQLKLDINKSKDILRSAQENLKELNNKVKKSKQLLDIANKVVIDASLIDKYISEIESFKEEISNLREKLIPFNTNKSREEVEEYVKAYRKNISEKRNICDSDSRNLEDHRKEYQDLREEKSKIENDKLNLEKIMHGKPQLLEQLVDLEKQEEGLEFEIKRVDQELVPLRNTLENFKHELESFKDENDKKYKESITAYNQQKSALINVKKNQNTIELFAQKNIEENLLSVLERFKTYKMEEESLNKKKKECSEKIIEINDGNAKAEINKRNLEDNVEFRKSSKEIKALDESIKKIKDEIGAHNYQSLQREKHQLQTQSITLIKEISNIKGQREILEENIQTIKNELEEPDNKNAYDLYKRKLFEVQAKSLTTKDAEIYTNGLEDAIIEFHKEKMCKINETIKDLWRQVYRGNDIDFIQIKTEQPENDFNINKRTYNYRVVQIKNDVEIDMRGRCSAGQKVLACLLIRMALAMTFSHNCGILTLDEPTTNLDRENINSLCEALANMIQSRRVERSFQLIIITHDEEFIKTLSQMENIDHYLRVKRNNHGNTVIEQMYHN